MIKVLIVDDDDSIRTLCFDGLNRLGFETSIAASGNEAKKMIDESEFDIVVTDLYMDDGGGQQLIEWCIDNHNGIKLLAVSGEELNVMMSALDIVGDKGIPTLEKPYEIKQLAEVINGIIGNQFF